MRKRVELDTHTVINQKIKELRDSVQTRIICTHYGLRKLVKSNNDSSMRLGVSALLKNNYDDRKFSMDMLRSNIMPVPYCCGAATIYGMYVCLGKLNLEHRMNRAQFIKEVAPYYRLLLQLSELYAVYVLGRTHLMYYVTEAQPSIREALEQEEWIKISDFKNQNSGKNIRLYELAYDYNSDLYK